MQHRELKRIVTQFTKGVLGKRSSKQMCYAVCAPLYTYLLLCGYQLTIEEGEVELPNDDIWEHYWLQLPDGTIIDPTADQFEVPEPLPRIYIGEKPNYYKQKQLA